MAGETIFAIATGAGQTAISVIRLTGWQSHSILETLTSGRLPAMRELVRRDILSGDGSVLDQAMIVLFEQGRSFTNEPMAEIHCHGSPAILTAICDRLGAMDDCRMAEPGEFTLRAFQAGRMDLTEAEGLADLISAQTEAQRRNAMRLVQGEAGAKASKWREELITALALLEVTIDWADEEVPEDVGPEVRAILEGLVADFDAELALADRSEKLRTGFEVAIIGPPNVGKSSLLNAIVGREAAIISEIPGTTRDVIEVALDLGGLPVRILDTAGLRETEDPVEAKGVDLALSRAGGAELRIFLRSDDTEWSEKNNALQRDGDLVVWSKSDLGGSASGLAVSAKTGQGVDALLATIEASLRDRFQEFGLFGEQRRRGSIALARRALSAALTSRDDTDAELFAGELRYVLGCLDQVIGRVGVEDVLGSVFSRFCLGK